MFDIGFLELLVVGVVGLLVLGPERLPRAARTAGLWLGKIKRSVSSMQREINSQLEAEELRQKLKEQQAKLDESLNKAKRDVESIAEPTPPSQGKKQEASDKAAAETAEPASPLPASRLDTALASARAAGNAVTNENNAPSDSDKDKDAASR
ncbi:MAG: twin-arginine translocase subunit TatB [Halomonadaceae bacterium]|nr:twin-arginine translocase subunit TatB [Halomonadaceae bacterium]